jgi:hypothetical protein
MPSIILFPVIAMLTSIAVILTHHNSSRCDRVKNLILSDRILLDPALPYTTEPPRRHQPPLPAATALPNLHCLRQNDPPRDRERKAPSFWKRNPAYVPQFYSEQCHDNLRRSDARRTSRRPSLRLATPCNALRSPATPHTPRNDSSIAMV